MPHAPLLLEEISGPDVAGRVRACADAVRALTFDKASAVVLISPHGEEHGIYAGRSGDLDGFGGAHIGVETTQAGDLADEIRRTWHAPAVGAHLDHGIVVPLALGLLPDVPVVPVAVTTVAQSAALADAITAVAGHRSTRVAVVASGHTGAALTQRAPLALRPEAVALEDDLVEHLPSDAGVLRARAEDLDASGSCGAAPLAAFGRLFAGYRCEIAAYERTFGVGYLVATVHV